MLNVSTLLSTGFELNDDRRERQIINWQKFRSLDYMHRYPNAFQMARAHPRFGLYGGSSKLGSKYYMKNMHANEEGMMPTQRFQDPAVTAIGNRLVTEFIESRLQALEAKLSGGRSEADSEKVRFRTGL